MNVKNTVKRAPASGSSSPNANRAALQIIKFCLEGECANLALDAPAFPAGLNRMQHRQQRSYFAVYFNERIARSGRSFRAPDQALESKDERIYLWRTQWDLHRRSSKNSEAVQRRHALCGGSGSAGKNCSIC